MKFRVDSPDEYIFLRDEASDINGLILQFIHRKEVLERENPDYCPTDYIEALDEPLNLLDDDLIEWEWE